MHSYFDMDMQKMEDACKDLRKQAACVREGTKKILQLIHREEEVEETKQMIEACRELQQFSENIQALALDMEYIQKRAMNMEKKAEAYCRQISWDSNFGRTVKVWNREEGN